MYVFLVKFCVHLFILICTLFQCTIVYYFLYNPFKIALFYWLLLSFLFITGIQQVIYNVIYKICACVYIGILRKKQYLKNSIQGYRRGRGTYWLLCRRQSSLALGSLFPLGWCVIATKKTSIYLLASSINNLSWYKSFNICILSVTFLTSLFI